MREDRNASYRPTRAQLVVLAVFAAVSVGFAGYAVDINNIHAAQTNLQNVIDTAAMDLVNQIDKKSDDDIKNTLAQIIEEQLFADDDLKSLTVSVDRKQHKLTCNAKLRVESTLTSLIGPDHVDVSASTETVAAN